MSLKMRKILSAVTAVVLTASLSACRSITLETPNFTPPTQTVQTEPVTEPEVPITTIPDIPLEVPEISIEDFSELFEAENGVVSGGLETSSERDGASGSYVTGFSRTQGDSWTLSVTVPTTQHYDISVRIASDGRKNNRLIANNIEIGEMITSGDGFESIVFENVFLEAGVNLLSVREVTGGIDIDYVEISSNMTISELVFEPEPTLINENANDRTRATMEYLCSVYGEKILSGQFATIGENTELELIYKTTGHYPAIRFGDLMPYTLTTENDDVNEIETAIEWAQMGGLVGYVWHWASPLGKVSYYTADTDFDLSKAVTEEEVALLSAEELDELLENGEISEECRAIIRDIDKISAQLELLQQNNVTVLWRPLHEASGGWFWWGAHGFEAYEWLWRLLYSRMTDFHNLNNLIWIWNAQAPSWYVGDEWCDIISADVYSDHDFSSQIGSFLSLYGISENKLIALSECSNAPDPNNMFRDRAMWSWYGVWSGDYVMDNEKNLSDAYTDSEQWIKLMSNEGVLTLEKLPDLRRSSVQSEN